MTSSRKCFIYSGTVKGGQSGVGILLNNVSKESVLGGSLSVTRILKVRLQTKHLKMSIIQCYAPTNDHKDEFKDEFYNALNNVMEKIPKHDITIVMGNMNAKIAYYNMGVESIIRTHAMGDINKNGERLLEFCLMNGILIGGSLFQHKDIHKQTWISSDGLVSYEIDYLRTNKNFRSFLRDVPVYRGADINSDHYLCVAKIQLKLKRVLKQLGKKGPSINKLHNGLIRSTFNMNLANSFQTLQDI